MIARFNSQPQILRYTFQFSMLSFLTEGVRIRGKKYVPTSWKKGSEGTTGQLFYVQASEPRVCLRPAPLTSWHSSLNAESRQENSCYYVPPPEPPPHVHRHRMVQLATQSGSGLLGELLTDHPIYPHRSSSTPTSPQEEKYNVV